MAGNYLAPRHGAAIPARPSSPDPHSRQRRPAAAGPEGLALLATPEESPEAALAALEEEAARFAAQLRGRQWSSMREAKAELKKLEHNRSHAALKLDPMCDGGGNAKLLCEGAPECTVSYGIYSSGVAGNKTYRIGKVNALHSGCLASNTVSSSSLAGLEVVQRAVLANPSISGKALLQQANKQSSVAASLYKVYRAKKMVLGEQKDLVNESFGRVAPYLEELQRLDPGTHVNMEVASDGTFQRFFVALGPCVQVCQIFFCSKFRPQKGGMYSLLCRFSLVLDYN